MDKKRSTSGREARRKSASRGRGVPAAPAAVRRPVAPSKRKSPGAGKPAAGKGERAGKSAVDEILTDALGRVSPPHFKRTPDAAAERQRQREARNAEAEEHVQAAIKATVAALLDKKAEKLVVLHLAGLTSMSDYFVLASATNQRQSQAMADAVEETMKAKGRRPLSVEGYVGGSWILVDYGDVVFHLFQEDARRFYALERLWGDAPDQTQAFTTG